MHCFISLQVAVIWRGVGGRFSGYYGLNNRLSASKQWIHFSSPGDVRRYWNIRAITCISDGMQSNIFCTTPPFLQKHNALVRSFGYVVSVLSNPNKISGIILMGKEMFLCPFQGWTCDGTMRVLWRSGFTSVSGVACTEGGIWVWWSAWFWLECVAEL